MLSSLAAGVLLLSGALSVEGKTTDYLAKCANELEDDDVLRVAVIGGQACLYFVVGVFYWTRSVFPVLWLIGPLGTGAVRDDAVLIVNTICDICSKLLLTFYVFFVRNQWQKTLQIEEATAKADPTSPRRNDRHMSFVTGNKNTAEENAAARAATLARLEVEKLQSERADLEIGRGSLGESSPSGRRQLSGTLQAQGGVTSSSPHSHQVVINNLFDAQALLAALRKAEANFTVGGEGGTPVFNRGVGGGKGSGSSSSRRVLRGTAGAVDSTEVDLEDDGEQRVQMVPSGVGRVGAFEG
uniref:Uncharacterized protein n=1 Tax=Chromera velia CCMP2878 TaxID=1169474 RepID=A0A0G4HW97_9ALVE|eukprot:Cvel_8989.t1-p1 / transcript=Cvel_8989.t1 / gene=Cvel_8989 / organism=Chromera_velia_CCMP2878 / gene_product=hypothetical protein / transcript_product=hypothetical protein / location=Cvel_scaffold507:60119-63725(+) / protein_length=297 / sequence_SO=supercontig / SO=protein_coding / is_pseudo=false